MEYDIKEYEALKNAVVKLGEEYVAELQIQLVRANKNSSGKLYDSLQSTIKITNQGIQLLLKDNGILKFVDQGRRPGKQPPVQAIRKWIDQKGMSIQGDKDEAAFCIARSIGEKGIKPTNIIRKAKRNILEGDSFKELTEGFSKDLLKEVKKIIKTL